MTEGLEVIPPSFDVHCVICMSIIPPEFAKKKGVVTCVIPGTGSKSPCRKRYEEIRRQLIAARRERCRSCNSPINAAELALYRQWRKETQPKKIGRPKKVNSQGGE